MKFAPDVIWNRLLRPAVLATLLYTPAQAVLPSEQLSDPDLEARASVLSKQLRCVVCQNQNIDDSGAPIAADMRILLRERIAAGATDDQAVEFLVERYGNFVLLKPPFQPDTWFLWIAPFAILVLATAAMAAQLRRRPAPERPLPLNDEESDRLPELT